jgi:GNAT superfamily N-acetyltransferase
MTSSVRQATSEDAPSIKELQALLIGYERHYDDSIPKQDAQYYDIDTLINDPNTNLLVVESENQIIGCGFGRIESAAYCSFTKNSGMIGLMVVKKEFRRQQIGKLIMENLLNWFKEKGITDIRLKVHEGNLNAVEAYTKYGFKPFLKEMKYES